MHDEIMKSSLAGTWYSEDPVYLAREVDAYLAAAGSPRFEQVMALILPHAGYRYSGMVAAKGVRQLEGTEYSRVIILGPSHHVPLIDEVSMPDMKAIETPFGRIPLDVEMMDQLLAQEGFTSLRQAHTDEHSVQIELPMLQHVLKSFKILPIVCGQLTEKGARRIGQTLLRFMTPDTLLVISTDFTHYGRRFGYVPFTDDVERRLETLDMGAFELIKRKDCTAFVDYVERTGATICGRGPLAVLLSMLPESASIHLLKYETSGSLTGDWTHCVSYVSAAVTGTWPDTEHAETAPSDSEVTLTPKDRVDLLRLARHTLIRAFNPSEPEPEPELDLEKTAGIKLVAGLFVTLHESGQLRGCIGEILPRRPLYEGVPEQARNAAFHDPRFPCLQLAELDRVDIEISVLTPPREVPSFTDIEIGRHGMILSKGPHSAVFLPQVAPEQGWDLEETLSHLAMKAGLDPDGWQTDCAFQVFEAIVFGEKDPG